MDPYDPEQERECSLVWRLYPHLTREQVEIAYRNLEEYIRLATGLYIRAEQDLVAYAKLKKLLNQSRSSSSLKNQSD